MHPPCRLDQMIPSFTGKCSTAWPKSPLPLWFHSDNFVMCHNVKKTSKDKQKNTQNKWQEIMICSDPFWLASYVSYGLKGNMHRIWRQQIGNLIGCSPAEQCSWPAKLLTNAKSAILCFLPARFSQHTHNGVSVAISSRERQVKCTAECTPVQMQTEC